MNPLETLRHHVTGAIERGEAEPITEIPAPFTHGWWLSIIEMQQQADSERCS